MSQSYKPVHKQNSLLGPKVLLYYLFCTSIIFRILPHKFHDLLPRETESSILINRYCIITYSAQS